MEKEAEDRNLAYWIGLPRETGLAIEFIGQTMSKRKLIQVGFQLLQFSFKTVHPSYCNSVFI